MGWNRVSKQTEKDWSTFILPVFEVVAPPPSREWAWPTQVPRVTHCRVSVEPEPGSVTPQQQPGVPPSHASVTRGLGRPAPLRPKEKIPFKRVLYPQWTRRYAWVRLQVPRAAEAPLPVSAVQQADARAGAGVHLRTQVLWHLPPGVPQVSELGSVGLFDMHNLITTHLSFFVCLFDELLYKQNNFFLFGLG